MLWSCTTIVSLVSPRDILGSRGVVSGLEQQAWPKTCAAVGGLPCGSDNVAIQRGSLSVEDTVHEKIIADCLL